MEYALRGGNFKKKTMKATVLILVLMEYALRDPFRKSGKRLQRCLNPCFNGICSARRTGTTTTLLNSSVLILVLMEYALRANVRFRTYHDLYVLILVLMEYALRV